ncbi:MAG: PolC-type DNA polymerase III [Clostridia bacterium]|nr:PolC-type DNA polymerase III [Clostridia bacterium]
MMVSLREYMRRIRPGSVPDPGFSCFVSELRVSQGGVVEAVLLTERLLPPDLLVELEELLERHFDVQEALVIQRASGGNHDLRSDTAGGFLPWVLRHLRRTDPFLYYMLSGSPTEPDRDHVRILLPKGCASQVDERALTILEEIMERGTGIRIPFRVAESEVDLRSMAMDQEEAVLNPEPVPAVSAPKPREEARERSSDPGTTGRAPDALLENARYRYRKKLAKAEDGLLFGRYDSQLEPVPIGELNVQSGIAGFSGRIVETGDKRLVSGNTRVLLRFSVFDGTGTISCHAFLKPEDYENAEPGLTQGKHVKVQAKIGFDGKYSNDLDADVLGICRADAPAPRADDGPERRVELHCHTKMSARDAVADVKEIVSTAVRWGLPAIAITDHGVVQAFPDARAALQKAGAAGTKVIYGVECYLVDDGDTVAFGLPQNDPDGEGADADDLANGYVAIDVETTGLDPSRDRLIEIAAVRFRRGEDGRFAPEDRFVTFVDPGMPVPPESIRLTGITDDMLQGAPDAFEAVQRLKEFTGDLPVCAHNAFFDLAFIRYAGFRTPVANAPRIKFNPVVADTLRLSRRFFPDERKHRLDDVATRFEIGQDSRHRAGDDALVCGRLLDRFLQRQGAASLRELNLQAGNTGYERLRTAKTPVYHCVLLAADEVGLYHLYRIVSDSHLHYFYNKTPRVPRSVLEYFRAGLIVGAACEAGEVFRAVVETYRSENRSFERASAAMSSWRMKSIARFYDYLEIQPICNNRFMIASANGTAVDDDDLIALNRLVLQLGDAAGRPVCATCDAHFLEKRDGVLRQILIADMYDDFERQPDLYLRTTGEMLAEFGYLGERAKEVVIDNPVRIADKVQPDMLPFPDGFFPPVIENAAQDVERIAREAADRLYRKDGELPDTVRERIERELRSVIDNGFATMYYIALRLVRQSNADGYLVGSRGSVGSSLLATLCGITEVNPLAPHYLCPSCRHIEFVADGSYGSGYDLPDKVCPECGTSLGKEGQDIPFETFLGFNGDKTPDIDLNFSGEYQGRAQRVIEDMFGKEFTFKAGTISTYAEKNTMAMVRGFFEKTGGYATEAEKRRLASCLQGVRQTTGQHPGAVVVLPRDREIYDFTPIHHPADKSANGIITTHFDFTSMHDTILKLDVLGKDDPTMMRFLEEATGVEVLSVPFMDPGVMSLFNSTEALGIPDGTWDIPIGTLSIPEMGTFMARGMIRDIQPHRFYDLVQLMGLSHGTDVWVGNAQDLIRQGVCDITQVIGCRDSIMTALIHFGLSAKMSFDIMEKVRKGRGLSAEHESEMRGHDVPDWYIESCKKIKYLFPKAHAVAYAVTALRLAWFKVYRPTEYYCAFFTVRADEFDCMEMCGGQENVRTRRLDIAARRSATDGTGATALEERKYYILELIEEMHLRGILFDPVDLYRSDASRFEVSGEKRIRPPLNAVPGISAVTAARIVESRSANPFKSREDLSMRAGLSSAILSALEAAGCLEGIPVHSQLDLFSLG